MGIRTWRRSPFMEQQRAHGRRVRNNLADLIAEGSTVKDAGRALGLAGTTTDYHWRKIKDGLGWQAQ